jgi:hypothetical protein
MVSPERESVWQRARRDTRSALHSVTFWALEGAALAAGAYLFGRWGVVAPFVLLLLLFLAQLVLALVRQRNEARAALSASIDRAIVAQLATELRDIRRKIEKIQSMAHPTYWDGFQLPAARWDEFRDYLAKWPDLYAVVERAYVCANDVNEAVLWRRTTATTRLIGPNRSDGLDKTHDAAGVALDALGEPRGEPYLSSTQVAAQKLMDG